MADIPRDHIQNYLLRLADDDAFGALAPHLEPFDAEHGQHLFAVGDNLGAAYFLSSGIGSVISVSPDGNQVESGLFGRDGFSPTALIMGDDVSSYHCVVQVAGSGHRIEAAQLIVAAAEFPSLHRLLLKYVQVHSVQTAFTALSNSVHHIDERLARWILMCHDRMDGDEIALTHDYISIMLGVRRSSVTTALHTLEGKRFIRSERGLVIVRNRAALEDFAHDAYGPPEAEYERLLGPLRKFSERLWINV